MALWWLLRAGVARVGLVGVPFPCGAGRTVGGFGGFGGFEAWQTAALNAYKKPLLRPGGALEPLLWPCGGFCLREWRVLSLLGYLFPAQWLLQTLQTFQTLQKSAQLRREKVTQHPTGLRSKRPYVCLAVRLPLSLYSTPPPQLGGSAAPGR